jgi:hypothetical protein
MTQVLWQLQEVCRLGVSHLNIFRVTYADATDSEKASCLKTIEDAMSKIAHFSRALLRDYDCLIAACSSRIDTGD